jgi:sensor histidine kinase YesM
MPNRSGKPRKLVALLLGNFVLANLIIFVFCPACYFSWHLLSQILDDILYSYAICLALGVGNGYLIEQLDRRISWIDAPVKRLLAGALVLVGYSLPVTVVLLLIFNRYVFDRLTWETLTWANVLNAAAMPVYIAIGITTLLTARSFLRNWRQAAIDAEKLKREHLQAQYDALKNQVNPHFLFNSFNVLTDLVYVDQDLAVTFIQQLSQVFRYVLESSKKELVPLATELNFLKSYVFLLKIRFGENLRVELPETVPDQVQIVPLGLQLLVENAVKHNVVSGDEPLRITVSLDKNSIRVSNNLQRRNTVEHSTGMGLANIRDRYVHLSGKTVQITETPDSFTVSLPLITTAAERRQTSPPLIPKNDKTPHTG